MSNIGKKQILIPNNIILNITDDNNITIEGNLGKLKRVLSKEIYFNIKSSVNEENILQLNSKNKMILGTENRNIFNMIHGVLYGYKKILKLIGVGYKAHVEKTNLILKLGYSHEIEYKIPKDIKIVCTKPTEIIIFGISKEYVNQISNDIRSFKKPDSYKGKGLLFENEKLILKEGKKK